MAELFEDEDGKNSDVSGGGAVLGGVEAEDRVVPIVGIPRGGAPEQAVGVVGEAEVKAPVARAVNKVKTAYEPLEPEFNRVLSGNPGAPAASADLTASQRERTFKVRHYEYF